MKEHSARTGNGVNRRQFLTIAGLGFLAGIAAILLFNRWRRGSRSSPNVRASDDSMYQPRNGGGRQT